MADPYNNRRVSSGWASDVSGVSPKQSWIDQSVANNNRQRDSLWDTPSQKRMLAARSPQGNPSPRAYDSTIPEIVRHETRPLPQSYGPATQSPSQPNNIAPTLAGPSLPGYRDMDPGIHRPAPPGYRDMDPGINRPAPPGYRDMDPGINRPAIMLPGMDVRPMPMPMRPGMDVRPRPMPMPMRPGMDLSHGPMPMPMRPGMDLSHGPMPMPMRPGMGSPVSKGRPPDAAPAPQVPPDLSRLPPKPPRTWGNAIADAANTGMDIVDAGLALGDAGARYTWGAADQAFNVAGGKPIKYGSVNPFDEKMGMQFSDFMANRGLYPKNDTSNWEVRDIPAGVADMVMDPLWLAPPLKAGKLAGQAFKGLRGGYNAARAMMR